MNKGENYAISFICAMGIFATAIAFWIWVQRPTFLKELLVLGFVVGVVGVLTFVIKRLFFNEEEDPKTMVI